MEIQVIKECGYGEVWKELPFDDSYKISNFGHIINKDGSPRKFTTLKDGYLKTNFSTNGKKKSFTVHRLVMLTFIGERPLGYTIDHLDGNKKNNHLENLEYVTHKQNMQRAFINGLIMPLNSIGEHNIKAKLKEEDVLKTRELYSSKKHKQKELAKMFNVDQTQISCIVLRKNWKNI